MEITDYEKFIKKGDGLKQPKKKSIYAFRQPLRLLICGSSGSGKTNTVLDLIFKHQTFDHIYYICKDPLESKLQLLNEVFNYDKDGEPLEEPMLNLMTDREFLEYGKDGPFNIDDEIEDRTKHTLMVFDDAISFPKGAQRLIEDIFIRGRKLGISSIYITHRYFSTPKVIRANFTHGIFFRPSSTKEKNMIVHEISNILNPDVVKQILDEATAKHHSFLVVDNTINVDTELCKHMRKGFAHFLCQKE